MVTTEGDTTLERLFDFGLSINEAKAYLVLLRNAGENAKNIALKSGVPRSKVYTALSGLQRKGFAIVADGPVQRFHPVEPGEALASVVNEKHHRMERLFIAKDKLARDLAAINDGSHNPPQAGQFITLCSRNEVRRVTFRALERAEGRAIWVNDERGIIRQYQAHRTQLASLARRGLEVRGLAEVRESNRNQAQKIAGLCELRAMEPVPLRLWGTTSEVVIGLVTTPDTGLESSEDLAFWTTNPSFVGAIWELFEGWWARAETFI